jgi:hypothetical protein
MEEDLCEKQGWLKVHVYLIRIRNATARVADPDPYLDPDWIQSQSGQRIRIRIRIRIQEGKNDPQK